MFIEGLGTAQSAAKQAFLVFARHFEQLSGIDAGHSINPHR